MKWWGRFFFHFEVPFIKPSITLQRSTIVSRLQANDVSMYWDIIRTVCVCVKKYQYLSQRLTPNRRKKIIKDCTHGKPSLFLFFVQNLQSLYSNSGWFFQISCEKSQLQDWDCAVLRDWKMEGIRMHANSLWRERDGTNPGQISQFAFSHTASKVKSP